LVDTGTLKVNILSLKTARIQMGLKSDAAANSIPSEEKKTRSKNVVLKIKPIYPKLQI
jgi:hypothetical protein